MTLTRRQLHVLLAAAWLRPAWADPVRPVPAAWLVIAPEWPVAATRHGHRESSRAAEHWRWQPGQWLEWPALQARLDRTPETWLYAEVDPMHHCLLVDLVRARHGQLIDTPNALLAWLGPEAPSAAQRLPLAELPWLTA